MAKLRKVIFKRWIPILYVALDGTEHDTYGKASTINKEVGTPETRNNSPKQKVGTNTWSDYVDKGIFHTWSTSGDAEGGIDPVAIVELEDGTIKVVTAEIIKFID